MAAPPTICLYTAASPNGHKVSILLEELGLSYRARHLNLPTFEHKQPEFLEINPNGRIPALTDTLDDGSTVSVFESGSIMQYLVERYDKDHEFSYEHGTNGHFQTNNWASVSLLRPAPYSQPERLTNRWDRYSYSSRMPALVQCRVKSTTSCAIHMPPSHKTMHSAVMSTRPGGCIER